MLTSMFGEQDMTKPIREVFQGMLLWLFNVIGAAPFCSPAIELPFMQVQPWNSQFTTRITPCPFIPMERSRHKGVLSFSER